MNNWLFGILLWCGIGLTLIVERKPLQSVSRGQKWLFYSMAVLCAAMFYAYWTNIKLPMPTRFVIHEVAPAIMRWMKGGEGG